MSEVKQVTLEQFLEATIQIKRGRISGWALQGLIDDAPRIAFEQLLKKIVEEARMANLGCEDCYERVMAGIAIAGITREQEDITGARALNNSLRLFPDLASEARLLLEIANITHEPRDIDRVRQAITKGSRFSGYLLVKACSLIDRVSGMNLFLDRACEEAADINDLYLSAKAWVAIYHSYSGGEIVKIAKEKLGRIHRAAYETNDLHIMAQVMVAILGNTGITIEEARGLASHPDNAKYRPELFAGIAVVTRDPEDLEAAYLVTKEISKGDPKKGAKIWRLIARALAGIE